MIISGDKRLQIFPASGCSLQLRKIEVKQDQRSEGSRGVIYHPSTFNSHASTDRDGAAWVVHRATSRNCDATVDSTSTSRLRLDGWIAQDQHRNDTDQEC